MSNILDALVKQCLLEVLSERKNQDPTKEEMIAFLEPMFGRGDGFEEDAESAMYWFANFNHGGQWSNLYSVLSTSPFSPGKLASGPINGSMEEMMFRELEAQFGYGEETGEVDESGTHISGMRKDAARPAGSTVIDATVSVMGNSLQISTTKGHLTINLTPEQISQLKVELVDLSETSQPEPHDAETDTFQPSPRDRTTPSTGKLSITPTGQSDDWSRPIYTDNAGKIYVDINAGSGTPAIYTVTDEGEPEVPLKNFTIAPIKEAGDKPSNPTKLTNSERKKIGAAFTKAGLDGNGRFEKKEHGLSAITDALSSLGFELNMVSGDLIMGDKGQRNLPFRRANDPGADPFTDKPEIENSRIVFVWERMDGPTFQYSNAPSKFEILAYAS